MDRLNRALVALSVCAGFAVASCGAVPAEHAVEPVPGQQANAPMQEPLKPILSGKFVPPVRGTADIQYVRPKTTPKGKQVVTVIQVKNVSEAPIAGLKCSELWYDKQRGLLPGAGDTYTHKKLLQPGEVITITLTDDREPRMDTNQFQFSHANGQVRAKPVPRF